MVKLYKRIQEKIFYKECWQHGDIAIVHRGVVGNEGITEEHPCDNFEKFESDFIKQYKHQGYATIPNNEQLTIVSFRLMLYAVLMKCLDILVQYLIMLGIYIATRQVTIGFLVLVAGNLLCIIPGNWVAYSPFGLSSLTRISVVEPGIGISAVSAFGIEAAILTLMIAGILMCGYKKILN